MSSNHLKRRKRGKETESFGKIWKVSVVNGIKPSYGDVDASALGSKGGRFTADIATIADRRRGL